MRITKIISITRCLAALAMVLFLASGLLAKQAVDFDSNRARLLGHMIQQQLSRHHYSHKPTDDQLSSAAFDLYLKQLDFQKRFLLIADVRILQPYKERIDDAIKRGRLDLPKKGRTLLNKRIEEVREFNREFLDKGFDFNREDWLETDPEKLVFTTTLEELKERWRLILKYQVLVRYLNLVEDEVGTNEKGELKKVSPEQQKELRQKAREKVLKTNEALFSRMLDETVQDHYDRYLNAVSRAFDPHTNYLPPTSKEDFDISMRGSLEGIGATLREEDGYIKVVRVIPGSAAYRQGQLAADDLILLVAQGDGEPEDITDTRIRDAVALIRGKKGTEVRLTVKKPDGTRLVIPIIRDVVEIKETFVKSTLIKGEGDGPKIGYVKIPSFYRDYNGGTGRNCTDDLRKELRKLKDEKVTGLVLDLRNNGGGALSDAVSITGLFIKTGPVVQIRSGDGKIKVLDDKDRSVEYDGPMVVLVNRFSASASEILAGALQDYGRALIVGDEHTHGKGTVQAMLDLDRAVRLQGMEKYLPLGAVKVTIQKFYRISGESTQERGVIPDVILPSRMDGMESGEKHLDNSLPWDTINPASYSLWDKSIGDIEQVRQHSLARISEDEDFDEIRDIAEKAKIRREETRQILLLSEVEKERAELRQINQESGQAPHGDMSQAKSDDKDKRDPPTLDEEIAEDPYVDEGVALLRDLLGKQS